VVVDDDHAAGAQLLVDELRFIDDDAADRLVVRPVAQEPEHGIASLGRKRGSVRPRTSSKFASRQYCAARTRHGFPQLRTEVDGIDGHLVMIPGPPDTQTERSSACRP
jgi:hypothetical protein